MNKKDLKGEYLEMKIPMGIFQIRNLKSGKVFIASSVNLNAIFNRYKVQLVAGSHPNKGLQKDWNESNAENFVFEILEELEPRENLDDKKELIVLEDLWIEKEMPFDDKGYNVPKMTREEKLRMNAANRKTE